MERIKICQTIKIKLKCNGYDEYKILSYGCDGLYTIATKIRGSHCLQCIEPLKRLTILFSV